MRSGSRRHIPTGWDKYACHPRVLRTDAGCGTDSDTLLQGHWGVGATQASRADPFLLDLGHWTLHIMLQASTSYSSQKSSSPAPIGLIGLIGHAWGIRLTSLGRKRTILCPRPQLDAIECPVVPVAQHPRPRLPVWAALATSKLGGGREQMSSTENARAVP